MATIAELQTKMTLDSVEFKKAISSATQSVSQFSNNITKYVKYAAGIVTASLGGAFYGLISIISDTEHRVSDLVDTGTRLGIPVKQLQRLQYAAKQSGIGVDSINMALKRMLKNTQGAIDGNKELSGVFSKLGLNARELSKGGADEEYIAIAEAIKKIKNPAEQVSAAIQIFGRAGAEQLSLIKGDVKGLVKEFQGLGAELTTEQANSIESYGDSVSKLGTVWEGFKSQLTAALSGPLKELMNWITESIKNMGGLKGVAQTVAGFIVTAFKGVVNTFKDVLDGITKVRIALAEYALFKAKASLGVAEAEKKLTSGFSSDRTNQVRDSGINDLKNQVAAGNKLVQDLTATLGQGGLQAKLSSLSSSISQASSGGGGSGTINGKPFPGLNSGSSFVKDGKAISLDGSPTFIINGKSMNINDGPSFLKDGKPVKLDITINADNGLTANVVNSSANKDVIIKTVNNAITEAARGETR